MAKFLTNATAWLAKTVRQAEPTRIRYSRGEYFVVIADAVKGGSDFETAEADELHVNIRSIDWHIDPAKLVLNGSQTLPKRSDVIEELDDAGNTTDTYAVSGEPGVPEYEWDSQYRNMLRVHSTRRSPSNS